MALMIEEELLCATPWEGTRYLMEWEIFESVWQGMSVWLSKRSQR